MSSGCTAGACSSPGGRSRPYCDRACVSPRARSPGSGAEMSQGASMVCRYWCREGSLLKWRLWPLSATEAPLAGLKAVAALERITEPSEQRPPLPRRPTSSPGTRSVRPSGSPRRTPVTFEPLPPPALRPPRAGDAVSRRRAPEVAGSRGRRSPLSRRRRSAGSPAGGWWNGNCLKGGCGRIPQRVPPLLGRPLSPAEEPQCVTTVPPSWQPCPHRSFFCL